MTIQRDQSTLIIVILFFISAIFAIGYSIFLSDEIIMISDVPLTNEIRVNVTVTAYTASVKETNSQPNITASGERVRDGIVALSRDIEKDFGLKFGNTITLELNGLVKEYMFQDRMNKRWTRKIDIFMWDHDTAISFGKQAGVLIIKVKKEESHGK